MGKILLLKKNRIRTFVLVLFLLCSQFLLASHVHDVHDVSVEVCHACVVAQNAECDDALANSANTLVYLQKTGVVFTYALLNVPFDNTVSVLYLRGPPA